MILSASVFSMRRATFGGMLVRRNPVSCTGMIRLAPPHFERREPDSTSGLARGHQDRHRATDEQGWSCFGTWPRDHAVGIRQWSLLQQRAVLAELGHPAVVIYHT